MTSPLWTVGVYVSFQNGVGPKGEPSTSHDTASTVAEFDTAGHKLRQWNLTGKCDGLTADPANRRLIATVNEDGNSSLFTISPAAPTDQPYGNTTTAA